MEPGQDSSRYSYPLSGAKIGVVGLPIQTRSPPSPQALRPSCSPTPPRQIPHSTSSPPAASIEWRTPRDPSSTNEQRSGLVAAEFKHCVERMRSPNSVVTSMRNTGDHQQRRNHQLTTKRTKRGKWQSRWSTRRRQAWLNIRHRHVLVLGHGRHWHLVRHASEAAKGITPRCENKTLSQNGCTLCMIIYV